MLGVEGRVAPSAVVTLDDNNFDQIITGNSSIAALVEFYAPCKFTERQHIVNIFRVRSLQVTGSYL
jgi:hypothetical protein